MKDVFWSHSERIYWKAAWRRAYNDSSLAKPTAVIVQRESTFPDTVNMETSLQCVRMCEENQTHLWYKPNDGPDEAGAAVYILLSRSGCCGQGGTGAALLK